MKIVRSMLVTLLGAAAVAFGQSAEPEEGRRHGPKEDGHREGGERGSHRGERGERGGGRGRSEGAHADSFLRTHDGNADSEVTFDEFRVSKKIVNMSEEGKKRIFDHLDKNKDGRITRAELPGGAGPGGGGPVWQDRNRDGKVSFEEFAADGRLRESTPEGRRALFSRLDSDGDGFLTQKDFRNRPPGTRPWDRRRPSLDPERVKPLDKNEDGSLSYEEWKESPRLKEFPEERTKEWFERLDRNGDGLLNKQDAPEGGINRGPGERPGGWRPGNGSRRPPGAGPRPGAEGPPRPER